MTKTQAEHYRNLLEALGMKGWIAEVIPGQRHGWAIVGALPNRDRAIFTPETAQAWVDRRKVEVEQS